jgi:hypothetical protein
MRKRTHPLTPHKHDSKKTKFICNTVDLLSSEMFSGSTAERTKMKPDGQRKNQVDESRWSSDARRLAIRSASGPIVS